jgi:glycosyltransferase involved in cell wall biosynthesis
MEVLVSLEHRFDRTPDGAVWTQAAFARSFYSQYLQVFDAVKVVARVREVNVLTGSAQRADGSGVSFHAIPHYHGPKQFLAGYGRITRAARASLGGQHAVILRVGSQIASCVEPVVRRSGRPYALEVMCDPYEIFGPGCNDHLFRPVFRVFFRQRVKRQCRCAPAVSYVTEKSLQAAYPPNLNAFSASYSDVELMTDAYVLRPRSICSNRRRLNIVTVGSLEQPYKGVDVLIDAVHESVRAGMDLSLTVIGDGKYRRELQERAKGMGVRVTFKGWLPAGVEIRRHLDEADLFVLASRTEGLPRAMVEAMARALPCIGSIVGGIPELLPPDDLVPAGNAEALAQKLQEVLRDPDRLTAMSAQNLIKAQGYRDEVLRDRRNCFYRALREQTEDWLRRSAT